MALLNPPGPGGPKEKFITYDPKVITDPARYTIEPGDRTSPGQLAHIRPRLVCGSKSFQWPVGLEGFRVTGQAQLSLHHYLGAQVVEAQTLHREEGRIELTGTFPGLTSVANMVALRDTIRSIPPKNGMTLYAQGVFEAEQYVIPESWDFTHEAEDRTHSIGYSLTLIRTGVGNPIPDPSGIIPPANPGTGASSGVFIVRAGVRTFRQIAKLEYGKESGWVKISELNAKLIGSIPGYQVPMVMWPLGTKVKY